MKVEPPPPTHSPARERERNPPLTTATKVTDTGVDREYKAC